MTPNGVISKPFSYSPIYLNDFQTLASEVLKLLQINKKLYFFSEMIIYNVILFSSTVCEKNWSADFGIAGDTFEPPGEFKLQSIFITVRTWDYKLYINGSQIYFLPNFFRLGIIVIEAGQK